MTTAANLADQAVPQWHWASQHLANRSGADVFSALFRHQPMAVLLESPWASQPVNSRFSICAGAPRSATGQLRQWTPSVGSILNCLRDRLIEGQRCVSSQLQSEHFKDHLPFTGGWLGWLGYDTAWEIETLPKQRQDDLPFPVAFWYEPENFAVLDHQAQVLWLAATDPQQLEALEHQLQSARFYPCPGNSLSNGLNAPDADSRACGPPTMLISQTDFEAMVQTAKAHIQAGDIFQANLSVRFHASGTVQPWHLYQTLQQINPSPFASYWQTPWGCIVSGSPERLVQLREGIAQTRPIAGTRPRGATPADEQAFRQDLGSSPKERAEHTMLVDLGRNDLGRVCKWGTVQVDEFFEIETYSHVMHLVSNIVGELQSEADAVELIRALFPGGTITGCPKVRCIELIEALEPVRRNLFYGSCGFLDLRGFLDLNILIRTLLVTSASPQSRLWHQPHPQPAHIWGQVGAGIVADSDPTLEWLESLQKAKAQWAALQQIGIQ